MHESPTTHDRVRQASDQCFELISSYQQGNMHELSGRHQVSIPTYQNDSGSKLMVFITNPDMMYCTNDTLASHLTFGLPRQKLVMMDDNIIYAHTLCSGHT